MSNTPISDRSSDVRDVPAWRAFFSVLFVGFIFSGMVKPSNANSAFGLTACSVGGLGAAIYAIFIRNKSDFLAITWRLYLAFIGAAFVIGGLNSGSSGAGAALGASLVGGLFIIPPGIALFYWDNLATKIIFYFLVGCMILGMFMAIF